jgi:prevent-host-death family protein
MWCIIFISAINSTNENTIGYMNMNSVTANELKTKGISAVESVMNNASEVFISVRGQRKYVVIDAEKYEKFREFELDQAIQEAQDDIKAGRSVTESVEQHMQRMQKIANDLPTDLSQ